MNLRTCSRCLEDIVCKECKQQKVWQAFSEETRKKRAHALQEEKQCDSFCIECERRLERKRKEAEHCTKKDANIHCARFPNCPHTIHHLSTTEKKHAHRGVLCQSCKRFGFTLNDKDTYTCQKCQKTGGCKQFPAQMIADFKRGRPKLVCITCNAKPGKNNK